MKPVRNGVNGQKDINGRIQQYEHVRAASRWLHTDTEVGRHCVAVGMMMTRPRISPLCQDAPPPPPSGAGANGERCSVTHSTVEVQNIFFGHPNLRSSIPHPKPDLRLTENAVRRNHLWSGKIKEYFCRTRTVFRQFWVEELTLRRYSTTKNGQAVLILSRRD